MPKPTHKNLFSSFYYSRFTISPLMVAFKRKTQFDVVSLGVGGGRELNSCFSFIFVYRLFQQRTARLMSISVISTIIEHLLTRNGILVEIFINIFTI